MSIYGLAGRRPDPVDREIVRFPVENRELVARRIHELFTRNNASALVCSAACGADLIALEVAGSLKMSRFVIIPFERTQFRKTSVVDRPGDWGADYDRVVEEVDAAQNLTELNLNENSGEPYRLANEAIITQVAGLASQSNPARLCLVWEGAPRGPDDFTIQLAEIARERNWPVDQVLTI